jgi:hypothetical protein
VRNVRVLDEEMYVTLLGVSEALRGLNKRCPIEQADAKIGMKVIEEGWKKLERDEDAL